MSLSPALHVSAPSSHVSAPVDQRVWYRRRAWHIALLLLVLGAAALFFSPQPRVGRQLFSFPAAIKHHGNAVFSPDGKTIVAPFQPGKIALWDAATGQQLLTLSVGISEIDDVSFSPDGTRLLTTGLRTRVWQVATGEALLSVPSGPEARNDQRGAAEQAVFSPDGSRFATRAPLINKNSGKLQIYDSHSGQQLLTIDTATRTGAMAMSLGYSPDGASIVTGGDGGVVQVWDAHSGQLRLAFTARPLMVSGVAFSPDGTLIATANDHDLAQIWDAATGDLVRTIRVSPLPLIKWLGARPYGHVRDWTTSVAFSADGRQLACANSDGTAGVWDVQTGRQLYTIRGHTDKIRSVAFSPDGQRLVTSSDDRTVRVWELSAVR